MTLGYHAPKTKACNVCHKPFTPARPLQAVCSPRCAGKLGKLRKAAEKAETKARKRALETIPELIAKAQAAFNAFIRERDKDKGCFVCGRPFAPVKGQALHAGHVRSRGAATHLRFHEDNCMGECEGCNAPHGAKPHEIEAGAIRRIGQERYDALKNSNESHKWTHDELRQIAATYRQKRKELEKEQE